MLDASVSEALAAFHLPPASEGPPPIGELLVEASTLEVSGLPPAAFAVSVDGSLQEVEVRPDFPSARVGFAQIAGVFSNLGAFTPAPRGSFVDPAAIAKATSAALVKGVVPTSVVTIRSGQSFHEGWREGVFDLFAGCHMAGPDGSSTSLLDVLSSVLGSSGSPAQAARLEKCPGRYDRDCSASQIEVPLAGSVCPDCGTPLYFTDSVNTHDEVVVDASNLTALGRLMSVLELLTFLWQIRLFAMADSGRVLLRTAFILDGPLAMFGRPAGLKRHALRFLLELDRQEKAAGRLGLPAIIGVEKGGVLAEHVEHIKEHIPCGWLLTLPDAYIREHVQHRTGSRAYGYDTDYGRRFVYRAKDGRCIVFSTPPMHGGDPTDDAAAVDLAHYPQLDAITELLDRVGTMLYRNAIIPVAMAHNFASLPLGTGSQVLTYLAQDALGLARGIARPTAPG